jgi:hypothetical protein
MMESLLHGIANGLAGEETGSKLVCRSRASELMADSCHNRLFAGWRESVSPTRLHRCSLAPVTAVEGRKSHSRRKAEWPGSVESGSPTLLSKFLIFRTKRGLNGVERKSPCLAWYCAAAINGPVSRAEGSQGGGGGTLSRSGECFRAWRETVIAIYSA